MTNVYRRKPDLTDAEIGGLLLPKPDASFRFMLRSGFVGEVTVVGRSFNRLYGEVQDPDGRGTFLMFNTPVSRVAVNRRHLAGAQFRADGNWGLEGAPIEDDENVVIVFANSIEPLRIEVKADKYPWAMVERMNEEEGCPASDVLLGNLIDGLERSERRTDFVKHLESSTDRYKESHLWLRLNDVAFVSVPFPLLPTEEDPKA